MTFKAKNFLITILIFLAIYQTGTLWFDNFSYYNIFSFLKNSEDISNTSKKMSYNVENIIINTGNSNFLNQYSNFSKTEYKKSFDEAILECTSKGKYTYEADFDINYILKNKTVIYNYSYNVKTNDLEDVFGINLKNIPKNIEFDMVFLVPNISYPIEIKTIFFNSKQKDAHIFTLNKNVLTENIYFTLDNFSDFETKYFYNLDTFENNFIPETENINLYINKIIPTNPLEQEGGVLLSGFEKYIDIFFDNHAIKWNSTSDDTYTYKDDNTIVKYYTNGVLEYVNYKASLTKEYSPYEVALNFLEKDINIKNEYYLKNYEITSEGIVFYFDYKINNFPITLSDSLKKETEMQSMIEITVFENKVSKYKRIIYNFYIDEESENWNISFYDILEKFSDQTTESYDINLEYNFSKLYTKIPLIWKIKTEDTVYFENIEDSEQIWTGN